MNPPLYPTTRREKEVFVRVAAIFGMLYGLDWCLWYSEADGARARGTKDGEYPLSDWIRLYAAEQIAKEQGSN